MAMVGRQRLGAWHVCHDVGSRQDKAGGAAPHPAVPSLTIRDPRKLKRTGRMTVLRVTSKLQNQIADIVVRDANPIAFSPVSGRWGQCHTQAEADERGAVLAVAIADAMIDVLQNPSSFQVTSNASVVHPSSTGGYVVSISLNVVDHSSISVQILLPSATSDFDARGKAHRALLAAASDTVAHYWLQLTSLILQEPDSIWPNWAIEVRRSWVHS